MSGNDVKVVEHSHESRWARALRDHSLVGSMVITAMTSFFNGLIVGAAIIALVLFGFKFDALHDEYEVTGIYMVRLESALEKHGIPLPEKPTMEDIEDE